MALLRRQAVPNPSEHLQHNRLFNLERGCSNSERWMNVVLLRHPPHQVIVVGPPHESRTPLVGSRTLTQRQSRGGAL